MAQRKTFHLPRSHRAQASDAGCLLETRSGHSSIILLDFDPTVLPFGHGYE
jgi:hypothetical protein